MRRRISVIAAVAAMAVVITACGSSSGPSSSDTNGDATTTTVAGTGAYASLASMTGKTIGVQSDTTGETYANEHKPAGAKVKDFAGTDELFAALASNQIQGILQDLPINAYRTTKDKTTVVVETYKTNEQYGFVVKKGNAGLLGALNTGLGKARSDGTYDSLFQKYFNRKPEGATPTPTPAGSDPVKTVKSGTLTMCSDIPYAPMEFEGDGPSGYTGFDVELMNAIAKANDLELAVIDVDFDGILGNLAAGKCDVVGSSVTITDERKKEADFTDPYFDADQSLLVKTK